MPTVTVILNGYTQFVRKIALTKLIAATDGRGLKAAKDQTDRLLRGESLLFAFATIGEAQSFLDKAVQSDVTGHIPGVARSTPALDHYSLVPERSEVSRLVIVGATWVKWWEPGDSLATPGADEADKARRVLTACQQVVTAEAVRPAAEDVEDDAEEIARFADALTALVDSPTYAALARGRKGVAATPVLTEFGLYSALFQDGNVFAAIRIL